MCTGMRRRHGPVPVAQVAVMRTLAIMWVGVVPVLVAPFVHFLGVVHHRRAVIMAHGRVVVMMMYARVVWRADNDARDADPDMYIHVGPRGGRKQACGKRKAQNQQSFHGEPLGLN